MSLKFIIILATSFSFPFIIGTPSELRTLDPRTLKPLPINIDSFATMKQGGYIYVDKTAIILKLIKSGRKFNHLARPEGFGKSLLLSTMDEIFSGHKELFKDTKIYESDYEWSTYPVVKIDFPRLNCRSPTQLKNSLMRSLREMAKSHEISDLQSRDIADCVKSLIEGLCEKFSKKVVFLIDEHEHAYLKNFNPQEKADEVHTVLKDFYSSLRNKTEEIEFCFTTHVNFISRITSKQHLYSHGDDDIGTDLDYAHITGFTQEEVEIYFKDHVEAVAIHKNVTTEEVYEEMRSWYYGYRFREDLPQKSNTSSRPLNGTQFYNPYSILKYLQSKEAGIYWSELQTPTVNSLLQEFIEREPWNALIYLQDRNENTHWAWSFVDLKMYGRKNSPAYLGDNGNRALNKFMLERGYFMKTQRGEPPLTASTEIMDFANREVEEIFRSHLTKVLGVQSERLIEIAQVMREKLLNVQIDEFIANMNTFFSMLPPFVFSTTRKMPKDNSTDSAKLGKAMFRWNFHGALIVTRLFNGYDYFKVNEDDPLRGYANHCPNYIFYLRTTEENAVEECSWGDVPSRSDDTTSAVCLDLAFNATSRQIVEWDTTIRKIILEKLGKKYLNADP